MFYLFTCFVLLLTSATQPMAMAKSQPTCDSQAHEVTSMKTMQDMTSAAGEETSLLQRRKGFPPESVALGGWCWGDSPSGQRYWLVQPQHTGTGSTVRYLWWELEQHSCKHGHQTQADPSVQPQPTFAFAFGVNPYKRMLSSFAYHKQINTSSGNHQEQVDSFRKWVRNVPNVHLPPQATFLKAFPVKFLGCLSNYERDMRRLTELLGFKNAPMPENGHCVTSCGNNTTVFSDWYDKETEELVWKWFKDDFDAYGFDTVAKNMNNDSCKSWVHPDFAEQDRQFSMTLLSSP